MATIRKRGESYQIRVSCSYNSKGEQVVQSMTWKPEPNMTPRQIEKELQRQAVHFEEKCMKGSVTAAIKFEDFAERWFEEYGKINLRHTTFERTLQLRVRTYPAIGHHRLDKLTARHIQQFANDMVLNGKNLKTGKPIARKTVVHHLSFISGIFDFAIKMDMLTDNPCRRVSVPKEEQKEKEIYSNEELIKLFSLLETAPLKYKVFFTLAIYSGFRRGELLGLEWKDIDWNNNTIKIRRTSNYSAVKGIYTDTTKTKKSQRSLKFGASVMELLKHHRIEQEEERERLGDKWIETDRLFVKWNGNYMNNQTPYWWLEDLCKKNDMPFHGIHQCRHLNASLLINAGVDAVSVSRALGHSQVSTTTNIYCHMFDDYMTRISNAISEALDFGEKEGEGDLVYA